MPEYHCPAAVHKAVSLLNKSEDIKIIAGGTDLMVHRRESDTEPAAYLDITRIPRLRTVEVKRDMVWIGAAVTFAEIELSEQIGKSCDILCQAAASIGSPQIRSCATIGGNIANASPAADSVPVLAAMQARAELEGPKGTRCVPVEKLIVGMGKTAIASDELLTGVYVPVLQQNTRAAFDKIGRRKALTIARMNGACILHLEGEQIQDAQICIGAVMNRPQRCKAAEALLKGCRPDRRLFRQAGEAVREMVLDHTGLRASSAYKLPVVVDFTQRLLEKALMKGGCQDAAPLYFE
ncbi:MAG TPA: xanthine dehydrogenase family protein subunit M [Candidatus Fimenecus excrementavium]|nr:xanthine dehydrogenase family protein subunit M [Candidatus Fimenecus excrementavium]